MTGYHYLASPYTHSDPLVREMRYLETAEALKHLLERKIWTYSPIVHCHELAKLWGLPVDAEFWKDYDTAMIRSCCGLFVLRLDGWHASVGVKGEIELAAKLGKPITYLPTGGIFDADSTVTIHPHSGKPPAEGVR